MYPQIPLEESRILSSPNSFKLACFGFNAQGGCSITEAPGGVYPTWEEQVRIAQLSEAANLEALLPGARWAGFGGATNFQGRSFETFAWAAGLAAITSKIQVFSTFHVPTAHPVRVAKTIATIDHISRGRFGVNIVAGWNAHEIGMFGAEQREHDDRYEYAEDFFRVVNELLSREGYFDIDNAHFQISGAYSEPKAIQTPRPVYMAAGMSPRGRDFAAQFADISFIPPIDMSTVADLVADTKRRAREDYGREILVFSQSPIVCADTEQEARDYMHHYVDERGDFVAARNLLSTLFGATIDQHGFENAPLPEGDKDNPMLRAMVAGHGGAALVGSPDQVVEGFKALADAGFDGAAVSWLDYEEGLQRFDRDIRPLMIQAGLRVDEPVPASARLPAAGGPAAAMSMGAGGAA
jgi:FMNH2-dependent dimethyl sulfone monooxygenase